MTDEEVMKVLLIQSDEFRRLGQEHRELEEKLEEYNSRVYLNSDEEAQKKSMQKLKLKKKDRMAELIRGYKDSMSLN